MRKIIDTNAYDFGEEQIVEIPLSRTHNRLAGADLTQMLKSASETFINQMRDITLEPGEVPVHINAIGATERYSCNRNGDGFKEAACKKYHDTFVKHAKFYRNHKSNDPTKSYGIVKASHYNDKMRRIELIVALNGTKEAAERNGGLVADTELQKLASKQQVPTSMGCFCSHDICSGCGHKAKTRADYCDAGICKAGGLKKNIGQLVELNGDLHHLHADTPDPMFNDISHVPRQADRISYITGVLQKAASVDDRHIICGAELAELLYEDPQDNAWKKLARTLIGLSSSLDQHTNLTPALLAKQAFTPLAFNPERVGRLTSALAEQDIILPINEFAQLFSGKPVNGDFLKQATANLFERLIIPAENPYAVVELPSTQERTWAAKLAADYSLSTTAIMRRLQHATINGVGVTPVRFAKQANQTNPLVEEVAQQYGLYVLASLEKISRHMPQITLTATACLLQNQI